MAVDLEERLRVLLASGPQAIYAVETLQISHSAMTQVYHLWREPYAGTTSPEGSPVTMRPANFRIRRAGSRGHLDQVYTIDLDLTDAADEFREQIDRIPADSTEAVQVVVREFISDDLAAVQSSATLEVESAAWVLGAASITAVAPRFNALRTGETYNVRDVPMLRGFI